MASAQRKAAKFATSELIPLPTDIVSETFEAAKIPATELESNFHAAIEKGVTESRAAFADAKISADETAHAIEKSYNAARDGVIAINARAFAALRSNAEANLEFMKAAFGVKSMAEFIALQSEYGRKQVDALTGHTKDLGALTQKTVVETFEPLKDQVAKSFKIAV